MGKTKRRSRASWTRLVAEYERSPGSKKEFAARHGVNWRTFESWYYLFRRESREARSVTESERVRLVEVALPAQEEATSEPTLAERVSQVEVTFPSGIQIRFGAHISASYLRELIAMTDGRGQC